ncbi:MAG: bifunctional precorrin-2 dehydrogenase/sirohydrochlorin ferrochelatase [Acidimicrobiia bacterium]|nr:bifunctional precorrin-2 dehydrogenase/sirohydrochlorin ferrochelatase [Acidimicrobiia bacterium]
MTLPETLYPVNLVLEGRPVLVVGGGRVAAQKVPELVRCGAVVRVVALSVRSDVAEQVASVEERPYRSGEAADYHLVVTTTDDPAVNRQVHEDAEAAGVLVNSADDPANCSFTLPSRVRQGPLLVTFSTAGRSPAIATWLRRRFTEEFGPEYATLIEILAAERDRIRAGGESSEDRDWQSALDSGMLEMIREGRLAEAKERLAACLSSSSD